MIVTIATFFLKSTQLANVNVIHTFTRQNNFCWVNDILKNLRLELKNINRYPLIPLLKDDCVRVNMIDKIQLVQKPLALHFCPAKMLYEKTNKRNIGPRVNLGLGPSLIVLG